MRRALSHLRPGREVSLRARASLHAARRPEGEIARAARAPGSRARGAGPGELPRHGQPRDARCDRLVAEVRTRRRLARGRDGRGRCDRGRARDPARVLWGTDFPHPNVKTMPNDGELVDFFAKVVPDEKLRKRILVDNPARLYWADART